VPRRRAVALVVLAGAFASACDATEAPELGVTSERRGDTTTVVTGSSASVLLLDSVEVVWASDSLYGPASIGTVGDRIVIGDRDRMHFLTRAGEFVATVGRSGEGPNEFRNITGVVSRNDTLFVYDQRLHRLSFYDATGSFLGSKQQNPHADFPQIDRSARGFRLHGNAMTYAATPGLVSTDVPMDAAIVRRDLDSDGAEILGPWFWREFINVGRTLGESRPLGPRARMAVGPDGLWAHGDGQDYCIQVGRFGQAEVTEICREWERAPVSSAITDPDLDDIAQRADWDDDRRELFASLLPVQDFGSTFPSYDLLWFAENGDLWVRTWDEDRAIVLPDFDLSVELRAPIYSWDVFSSDGQLLRTLRISSNFEPKLILEGEAWGLTTLAFGERAIARIGW